MAKQARMEGKGFERQDAQPEIEKAAGVVDDLQTTRMEATKKEIEARGILAAALQKANLVEYRLDTGKVARLTTTTKAVVRAVKETEEEPE